MIDAAQKPQPDNVVLIVEDDADIARLLSFRMRAHGLEPVIARDAFMAVKLAKSLRPKLALLDIGLPGGDGFEVADRIRSLVSGNLPLIFITASRRPDLRAKARTFEPVAFFEKPYQADEVMATVDRFI